MLSPAVVGNFSTFYQPQTGLFNAGDIVVHRHTAVVSR